jgi:hypothetical protein
MKSCLSTSKCLLVAMACCTNLESLKLLDHMPMFTDATLPLLFPLTKLTHLSLHCPKPAGSGGWDNSESDSSSDDEEPVGVSALAQRQFLSGMPQLDSIDWT